MTAEYCLLSLCFVPLETSEQKFFGFSEFLSGLALMILAWTIADVRYRFRVKTAPIPLQGLTFGVVAALGALTLLTDLWRSEHWLVPQGEWLTPSSWQAILAGLFLFTFMTWTWFAFIRPPQYSKRNAKRFAQTLYRFILKGSPTELAVVADELAYSANSIVRHATDRGMQKYNREKIKGKLPAVEAYANDLLLLIADKRLCRAIVDTSPGTALAIFQAIKITEKYGIQVETFAKNIMNEALLNHESFIFHEAEGYESGLIGYHKPLSQAMFSNYRMVETIGTLFDIDHRSMSTWNANQWEAYCRVVLMTFRDYVDTNFEFHSFVLYRAKDKIERAVSDLYKLNGIDNITFDDVVDRLRVIVKFIEDAVEILNTKDVPSRLQLRIREKNHSANLDTFYDHLANMIFEVILSASAVSSPKNQCWWIQHNSVWGELFNFHKLDSRAGKIIKFKVRRLLYEEITRMNSFPNFKGAKILGFCLNVMGLKIRENNYDKDSRPLHKAVLAWTKKNYIWLHDYNPQVGAACLVDGMTYDKDNHRLVRTYPAENLRREAHYVYLELNFPEKTELDIQEHSLIKN